MLTVPLSSCFEGQSCNLIVLLRSRRLFGFHDTAQPLQSSVIMITDIHPRLPKLFTDFVDRKSFEEVKPQSRALLFRKVAKSMLQIGVPIPELRAVRTVRRSCFHRQVAVAPVIEASPDQVFSAIQRPMIGHLRQPGARGALRRIEDITLAKKEQK